MEENKNYLIIKKGEETIRQWHCDKVSTVAYLITPTINRGDSHYSMFGIKNGTEPFWILKSKVGTIPEQTLYTIIEELK